MEKKKYLMDIVLIRLVLIGLLILYHSLCIYTGAWEVPYEPFEPIAAYDWIGCFSHNFQLEAMVFISGSLLGYKLFRKPDSLSFNICVVKKVKRILLPCVIFGCIYYAMFYDTSAPLSTILLKIANGCGHLWFLPMIFWCFVFTYVIVKFTTSPNLQNNIKIYNLLLVIFTLFSIYNPFGFMPFGLGTVCSFMLYFYWGCLLRLGYLRMPESSNRNIFIAIGLFASLFIVYMLLRHMTTTDLIQKAIKILGMNICHLVMCVSAIFIMFGMANKPKVIAYLASKPRLITLSGYCYGVYIYQQFILKFLYYKTSLPIVVDELMLPWIAFIITLTLSLSLCWLTLRTRIGRFLIG